MIMASTSGEQQMDVCQDESNEPSLVERAANGDSDAFAELFNRYYSMIHAFSFRISLDFAEAQDITQETFIKAAKSLGSFRRESSFKNWLYRIATNTGRDWRRRGERQSRVARELASASLEVERKADHSPVADALAALPDDLREAIVLVYYEGLSHAAAARVLGCAEPTVSWRVFRAKRKIKSLLALSGA